MGPLDVPALTPAAVGTALGRSRDWVVRHWRDLVENHAFPAPLPGCGLRWDPMAVQAWREGRAEDVRASAAEAELVRRARQMAQQPWR